MSNAVFPALPGQTWSVLKRPHFSNITHRSASLRRVSVALVQYPTFDYTLTYDMLREAAAYTELQQIMGFFMNRLGSYDSFLFDDTTDDLVTDQTIGTGTGSQLAFQLVRTYGNFIQPVYDIKNSPTPIIKVNSVVVDPTHYSIALTSSGLLTFGAPYAPALGAIITGTYGYYWRVNFREDVQEFDNFMYKLWQLQTLDLVGDKP